MRIKRRFLLAFTESLVACASPPSKPGVTTPPQSAPAPPQAVVGEAQQSDTTRPVNVDELRATLDEIRSSLDYHEPFEAIDARIRRAKELLAGVGEYSRTKEREELAELEVRFAVFGMQELKRRADEVAASNPLDFPAITRAYTYGFETKEALAMNPLRNQALDFTRDASSSSPSSLPVSVRNDDNNFEVVQGRTYAVVERVAGLKVILRVRPLDGGDAPEPIFDMTSSRSGGVGIQLLPGAVVRFENIEIKILN